jgi:hypothetical protein
VFVISARIIEQQVMGDNRDATCQIVLGMDGVFLAMGKVAGACARGKRKGCVRVNSVFPKLIGLSELNGSMQQLSRRRQAPRVEQAPPT